MGQYDTQHRVKLVVDEYGPWYREGTELDLTHIFGQQITVRDGLATALTLDAFNRNPEKWAWPPAHSSSTTFSSLFMAHEDRFFATPNFHVFAMYAAHQGGQALRTEFSAPDVQYMRDDRPARFWGLNGSASPKKSSHDALHHSQSRFVQDDRDPGRSSRNAVVPTTLATAVSSGLLNVSIPATSVTKLKMFSNRERAFS